jgi:polyhydroxyalkanoate synthesis repressor PhaR
MATVNSERTAAKKPARSPRKAAAEAPDGAAASAVRIIKKYPNRRLYDTQASRYITLAEVKAMVLRAEAFEVRDAKDGHDLTRSILLQIILEEESGGVPMFSTRALEQIIRFYGHAMQGVMGAMLEQNLRTMVGLQDRFAEQARAMTPQAWTKFVQDSTRSAFNGNAAGNLGSVIEQMTQASTALFSAVMPGKK